MQRTLLYEHRRHGTPAFVKLCLDHQTSRIPVGIRLQFQNLRCQKDRLKQVLKPLSGLGRYRNKLRGSAPVYRDQFIFRHLLFHPVNVRIGLINLVDGNDDLDPRRLGVINSLHRLGHNAVVRSHNKHRDIGRVGAAHAHCRKCLMARRIQEGDALSVHRHGISTDGLRDTACLLIRHIGLTDRIQQGCLTMVYMPHNTDNGRSADHRALVFFVLPEQFLDHVYLDFLLADDLILDRDILRVLVADLGIQGHDLSLQEKFLDDHRRLDLHLIRQLFDGQRIGNRDHFDLFFYLIFCLLLRLDETTCLIAVLYRCVVLFINQVFLRAFVSVLIYPAFLFLSVLLRILGRGFRHKALLTVIFLKSIVLSAIASSRAVKTAAAPVRACTRATAFAIPLIVVIRRPALSARSAIIPVIPALSVSGSSLLLRPSGSLCSACVRVCTCLLALPLFLAFTLSFPFSFKFSLPFTLSLLLLALFQSALLLLPLTHFIRLRRNRNRLLGRSDDLMRRILHLNRTAAVA